MSLGVSTNLITEKLRILLVFLLLVHIISGCATVQETRGIPPTDISNIYVGIHQSEIENIAGKPILDSAITDEGYYAIYRFNRGYKPYEKHKGKRAALYEVINIMSFGAAYANRNRDQRALLKVTYDKEGCLLYAEEWMEHKCSNSPYAGKDCKAMQSYWLHPSTLPLVVTKEYQLADSGLKDLYDRAEKGDHHAKIKIDYWMGIYKPSNIQITKNDKKFYKEIGMYCPNAELGHADAQKHIGDFYYFGAYGIKKDVIQAYVWYSLAAKAGDIRAGEVLLRIKPELSPTQLTEAQKLLDEWAPGQCQSNLLNRERP